MKIELIYATWPNSPSNIGWYKLAATMRRARLGAKLERAGFQVKEHAISARGQHKGELRAAFELAAQIGALVKTAHAAGSLSIILCGSCSVASLGAICGLGGEETGILWMDAHPDLNTPATTMSGLFEGMAAATILGEAWQAMAFDIAGLAPASRRNLSFYGVRDIDAAEQDFIDEESIPIVDDADGSLSALGDCTQVYVHLDMDVHNARLLKANKFSGKGGPPPERVREHLSAVAAGLPVAALAITGLDPDIADAEAVPCAIDHSLAFCQSRRDAKHQSN